MEQARNTKVAAWQLHPALQWGAKGRLPVSLRGRAFTGVARAGFSTWALTGQEKNQAEPPSLGMLRVYRRVSRVVIISCVSSHLEMCFADSRRQEGWLRPWTVVPA